MSLVAVGFDLDYTLCVPERDRATLLAEAVAAAEAPPVEEWASRAAYQSAHAEHLTGETRAPVFETMTDGTGVEADPEQLATAYRERVNAAIRAVTGAEGLVRELQDRYRVGLLTNGPSVAQRSKLETLGWTELFETVLVSGDLPAGKPDGRAFRALFDALGVAPAELVYVGDDVEADIAGGTAAGCRVIQVVRDGGPDADPRADAHVRLDELVGALPDVIAGLD